jgi:outer membrane protein assembly factor BamE (lipoprotein component of BamABCDE complex)
MTVGMLSADVFHTRSHWYLFRTKRSDQRVVNIDVDNSFTIQVQFIRVERQSTSVGERPRITGLP